VITDIDGILEDSVQRSDGCRPQRSHPVGRSIGETNGPGEQGVDNYREINIPCGFRSTKSAIPPLLDELQALKSALVIIVTLILFMQFIGTNVIRGVLIFCPERSCHAYDISGVLSTQTSWADPRYSIREAGLIIKARSVQFEKQQTA
jgi:hypothetical protein